MAEKEYIDRDELIKGLMLYTWRDSDGWEIDDSDAKRAFIEEWLPPIPAADVREVVPCKDCKNRFNIDVCKCRGDDWFCGYGERKREES